MEKEEWIKENSDGLRLEPSGRNYGEVRNKKTLEALIEEYLKVKND